MAAATAPDASAVRQGVQAALRGLNLPLSSETRQRLQNEITGQVTNVIDMMQAKADARQQAEQQSVTTAVQQIEKNLVSATNADLDGASLAAAAEIFPRLAQAEPVAALPTMAAVTTDEIVDDTVTEQPTAADIEKTVGAKILAGLGEGEGEEPPTTGPASAATGAAPTQPAAQPDTSVLPDEAARAAVSHGKENLPPWDLSPKQKEAFAEQQLQEQLEAGQMPAPTAEGEAQPTPPAAGPETTQPGQTTGPAAAPGQIPAPGATQAAQVPAGSDQNIANQLHQERSQPGRQRGRPAVAQADQGLSSNAALTSALRQTQQLGQNIGEKLRNNIKTGKFNAFVIALACAVVKDILDLFDSATFATIIAKILFLLAATFITAIITAILVGQGTYFKRKLIKKYLGKLIASFILGFIPVLNIYPEYTIAVLMMEIDSVKNIRKQRAALKDLEKQMKALRKTRRSGGAANRALEQLKGVADD